MLTIDNELKNEILTGTNLVSGDEYKNALIAISDILAETLVKTLGPYAHTTIIDDGTFTYPTKDGYNILTRMRFGNALYQTLYGFLRNIAFSLVSKVGDGTTTSIIAANEFIKYLSTNSDMLIEYRQKDLLDTLTWVKDQIVEILQSPNHINFIKRDNNFEDIYKIAYTSSNGNVEISEMIRDIYIKTENPNIYIGISPEKKTTYEIKTGYQFDCAPIAFNTYINTDDKKMINRNGTSFFLFDHNLTFVDHQRVLNTITEYGQKITSSGENDIVVIMAPYFDDIIMETFGRNVKEASAQGGIPTVMLAQIPLSRKIDGLYLSDFSVLIGAQVIDYATVRMCNKLWHPDKETTFDDVFITKTLGTGNPQEIIIGCVGQCSDVTFTKGNCLINNYNKDNQRYINTLNEIETSFKELKERNEKRSEILNKDFMDASMRYTKFYGKMGVISIGGNSELEKHFLKDSIDDAVLASKSAYENGYIRGLNLETLSAIFEFRKKSMNEMADFISTAMSEVFRKTSEYVMRNKYPLINGKSTESWSSAGFPNEHVQQNIDKLCDLDVINLAIVYDLGYNIVSEEFEKRGEFTVINSVSTDIEILNAIVGILSLILTSNQLLSINRIYDKKAGAAQIQKEKMEELRESARIIADEIAKSSIGQYLFRDKSSKRELNAEETATNCLEKLDIPDLEYRR